MTDEAEDARKRAAHKLDRKVAAERDGAKARAAYDAESNALRARTERLRALRLAREAEDRAADPPVVAADGPKRASGEAGTARKTAGRTTAKRTGKTAKSKGTSLSAFLDEQGQAGRRR